MNIIYIYRDMYIDISINFKRYKFKNNLICLIMNMY